VTASDHAGKIETLLHERIKRAGLRLTLPRRAICAVLARHGEGFLTVQEILADAIEGAAGPIDPSTGHRTLNELARIGLVHHVHFGSQPGRWHLTIDHDHQHLACETCGELTLVPTSLLQPTFDRLRDEYGFYVSLHHFAILGQCQSCQATAGHDHD
jgi:Fe2+ or Zn2+ uptake regulation protein